MEPRNPAYAEKVHAIFERAAFVQHLGMRLTNTAPGLAECALDIQPFHLQQDSVIHAGVQATVADHTAGAAAATLVGADETVLTLEFKINLLRPAVGRALRCRAEVLRAGRSVVVVESSVFALGEAEEKLVSKATVTLAVVPEARFGR